MQNGSIRHGISANYCGSYNHIHDIRKFRYLIYALQELTNIINTDYIDKLAMCGHNKQIRIKLSESLTYTQSSTISSIKIKNINRHNIKDFKILCKQSINAIIEYINYNLVGLLILYGHLYNNTLLIDRDLFKKFFYDNIENVKELYRVYLTAKNI